MTAGIKANADGSAAIQVGGSDAITITSGLASTFAAGVSGTTGSFSGNMSFNSGYGSAAVAYGCRAWVNFNGTGTVAIRASGNVTSITDGGIGIYTVNFTTAMPDGNYAFSGIATNFTGGFLSAVGMPAAGTLSTSSCLVHVEYSASGGTFFDPTYCLIAVFR
jgi:hypothetical protein